MSEEEQIGNLLCGFVQCRAFAKALHYKEMEFEGARSKKMDANPVAVVEALIHINNQLHQHEVNLFFLFLFFFVIFFQAYMLSRYFVWFDCVLSILWAILKYSLLF